MPNALRSQRHHQNVDGPFYVYLPGPNVGAPANFDESRSFHPSCAAPFFLGFGNVKARNCRRTRTPLATIVGTRKGSAPGKSHNLWAYPRTGPLVHYVRYVRWDTLYHRNLP